MSATETHPGARAALHGIRLLHTIVWAFFAGVIVLIPIFAWRERFDVVLALAGVVFVEVAILAANDMRCPLTGIAGRFTADRRDNFDIYLPLMLARYNKQIFGSLYLAGLVLALIRWLS